MTENKTPDTNDTPPDLSVRIRLEILCAAKMVPSAREILKSLLVVDEAIIRDAQIRVTGIEATYEEEL